MHLISTCLIERYGTHQYSGNGQNMTIAIEMASSSGETMIASTTM